MKNTTKKKQRKYRRSVRIIKSMFVLFTFTIVMTACSGEGESDDGGGIDIQYIDSVEVLTPKACSIKLDNYEQLIKIDFEADVNISDVRIKLSLNSDVSMVEPTKLISDYDLMKDAFIKVSRKGKVKTFKIEVNILKAVFSPSEEKWNKKDYSGKLSSYISVYKYKKTISNKNIEAYIAVADMNNVPASFAVLGKKKGYKTPQQFYQTNSKPSVVLNGGYAWAGTSLGLMVSDGRTVSQQEPIYRNYNGTNTPYYPTQGAFGMDENKTFSANYAYESQGVLYAYPQASPNKAGEKPQNVPSKDFPADAKPWEPLEAIGAGPLLIKNGIYKNNWEEELYGAASGILPTSSQPRSAVAYHPSGYVVFFVCEGRNKTPDTPGLTLKEVAELFLDLGCTDGINLDGGGSSCMLIDGEETIKPSAGEQRMVTNAIALY